MPNRKNPSSKGDGFLFLAFFQFEMHEHHADAGADVHRCQQNKQVGEKPKLVLVYVLNRQKHEKEPQNVKKDASR